MAFPRSQRFVEKETCAPPPTAYHLPSAFDENNCSAWVRPCTFDHQCGQCTSSKNDLSMHSNKSNEAAQVPLCMKQRSCTASCVLGNKENVCCYPRKDGSNIPRFKKNVNPKITEPKAPSFMTRPRNSIHNCFGNKPEETSFQMTNFHRHSLKRKSMRLGKENKEKSSEDLDHTLSSSKLLTKPNLEDNEQLNVSYIIHDKNSDKIEKKDQTFKNFTISNKGAIPKKLRNITDDMKETESLQNSSFTEDNTLSTNNDQLNLNVEISDSTKELLNKNDSLPKEFLNTLDDTNLSKSDTHSVKEDAVSTEVLAEETTKKVKTELENAMGIKIDTEKKENILKSCDISSDVENHVVFLIADEFIDDEYDSYMKDITLEKLHTMKDADLYQICKSFNRIYMEKLTVSIPKRKVASKMKRGGTRKEQKNIYKVTGKLLKKKKNRATNSDIWSEVEKIVRSTITSLKGEFKNEIYRKTEEKVDGLMSKLARVLLKAEESIESRCERTTVDLINKLEKIVH